MTETRPALAVTTLLQDRATASARWPTRGSDAARRIGATPRPPTRSTARLVAGSHRQFGVEHRAVVAAHVQVVLAAERAHRRQHDVVSVHEPARRTAAAL